MGNSGSGEISRRDFLKVSAAGALGLVLSELGVDSVFAKEPPKIVNGVEVYGLEKPVENREEMLRLIESLDKKFLKENDPFGVEAMLFNSDELRDRLLPKNKRYLTIYVKESVYKSYLVKEKETGVDYATWVKEHVDYFNRLWRDSLVPVNMEVGLRRIVVVNDGVEAPISRHPMDTDGIWFEKEDYRDKRFGPDPGFFWHYLEQDDGSILFDKTTARQGGDYSEPVRFKTTERDSLNILGEGWLDAGFVHELVHTLNLPDPYTYDVDNGPSEPGFRFNTWSVLKPLMDPYLAMIMNENIKRGIRGYFSDPDGIANKEEKMYFYDLVPKQIKFNLDGFGWFSLSEAWYKKAEGELRIKDQYNFDRFVDVYENKGSIGGESFKDMDKYFGKRQMEGGEHYPLTYLIKSKKGDVETGLFFPRAILNMVYMAGKKEKVDFDIKMAGVAAIPSGIGLIQALEFVKSELLEKKLEEKFKKQEPLLATMALPGTNLTCIWSYVAKGENLLQVQE